MTEEKRRWEWEPWLYEFKKIYRGDGRMVIPTYETLRFLLDLWHWGTSPLAAGEVRARIASPGQGDSPITG